jgi:putative PIN family toxin of toxin-antitoxin system
MRVVIDTNVFVSGIRFGGRPQSVLDAMARPDCTLVCSEEILTELEEVLLGKFQWPRRRVESALDQVRALADMVSPKLVLAGCVDPDDNRILEAAVEGRADCIVSGDKHLLRLKAFRGIKIMTANDFLLRVGR